MGSTIIIAYLWVELLNMHFTYLLTYQVAWLGPEEKMTWQPESSLAQALIDEYEKGVVYSETIETESSYGVISHKLTVAELHEAEPPPKKKKFLPDDEHGYAYYMHNMHIFITTQQ